MTFLTSVKNSDSGFKKASKNIQVGDMKMISLQDWSYFHLISVLMIICFTNLSPELIEGCGSREHRTSVGEASLVEKPQLVAIPGAVNVN